jgi:hypothetical protein
MDDPERVPISPEVAIGHDQDNEKEAFRDDKLSGRSDCHNLCPFCQANISEPTALSGFPLEMLTAGSVVYSKGVPASAQRL